MLALLVPLLEPSAAGRPQLGFAKTAGTPSGNMAAGTIQLRGSTTDGQPDLAYIANSGTSGVTFLPHGPGGYGRSESFVNDGRCFNL